MCQKGWVPERWVPERYGQNGRRARTSGIPNLFLEPMKQITSLSGFQPGNNNTIRIIFKFYGEVRAFNSSFMNVIIRAFNSSFMNVITYAAATPMLAELVVNSLSI